MTKQNKTVVFILVEHGHIMTKTQCKEKERNGRFWTGTLMTVNILPI